MTPTGEILQTAPVNAGLAKALSKLELISERLRWSGRWLAYASAANMLGLIPLSTTALLLGVSGETWRQVFWSASAVFVMASVFLAVRFESMRKSGDALFKEISDELQWYVRFQQKQVQEQAQRERPVIAARIVLRTFSESTDVPLVPGKYGPLGYVLINLAMLAYWIVALR
jgi:hypothetical protein